MDNGPHFNPRSPCGERPAYCHLNVQRVQFQSTLPLRGATPAGPGDEPVQGISIHAPLAGSDLPPGRHTSCPGNFNPRSPCGERRPARNRTWTTSYFNPRSPCGERHYWVTHYVNGLPISIHAPLAGSDHARPVDAPFQPVFQSTLPLRGATVVAAELGTCYQFQSTLPLRGATSPFQLVVLLP